LERLLVETVPKWRRPDWEALERNLRVRRQPDAAAHFIAWRERHDRTLRTRLGRLAGRLPWTGG